MREPSHSPTRRYEEALRGFQQRITRLERRPPSLTQVQEASFAYDAASPYYAPASPGNQTSVVAALSLARGRWSLFGKVATKRPDLDYNITATMHLTSDGLWRGDIEGVTTFALDYKDSFNVTVTGGARRAQAHVQATLVLAEPSIIILGVVVRPITVPDAEVTSASIFAIPG